jgi:putative transposase
MKILKRNTDSVFNVSYHIIFCPKYRRKILINGIDRRLKELLLSMAVELKGNIENIEVMPDHVHLFIKSHPRLSIHSLVSKLKGYSAYMLRKEFPELKRKSPCMWTRSFYVETIGHISEDSVKKYIDEQKNK